MRWHPFTKYASMIAGGHCKRDGVVVRDKRSRFEVLRHDPSDYLYYRFVWNELRFRVEQLIPDAGQPTNGRFRIDAGLLAWEGV